MPSTISKRTKTQHRFPSRLKSEILARYRVGESPSDIAGRFVDRLPWLTARKVGDLAYKAGTKRDRTELAAVAEKARAQTIAELGEEKRRELAPLYAEALSELIRQIPEDAKQLGQFWADGKVNTPADASALMRAKRLLVEVWNLMFGVPAPQPSEKENAQAHLHLHLASQWVPRRVENYDRSNDPEMPPVQSPE
jgi:hypothetical protein